MSQDLMNLAQIARQLGVTPAALSNWQKRYSTEFPRPARVEKSRRLFRLDEITAFVEDRGLGRFETPDQRIDELPEMVISKAFPNGDFFRKTMGWSEETVKARDLVTRSIGELSNEGLPFELALEFTAVLAVQTMAAQGKITINPTTRATVDSATDVVEKWFVDRVANNAQGSTAPLHRQIRHVWVQSSPDVAPRVMATTIIEAIERKSRILRQFEHATPQTFAILIRALAGGSRILNLGSGIGLIARAYGITGSEVTAQEINPTIARIHQLIAALDGYEPDIRRENVLLDFHSEWQDAPFDAVVVNPPWNSKVDLGWIDLSDPRWRALSDFRSRNIIDYFIETALAYLRTSSDDETLRAIISVPPSWLFSDSSTRMRNFLVRNDYVESVIQLGGGVNLTTRIPAALLVLAKTGRPRQTIRMIDARELGRESGGKASRREFSASDVDRLVDALNSPSSSSVDPIVTVDVATSEVRSDRVNLDPVRYTTPAETPLSVDDAAAMFVEARTALIKSLQQVVDALTKASPSDLQRLSRGSLTPVERLDLRGADHQESVRWVVKTRSQGDEFKPNEVSPIDVVVSLGGPSLGEVMTGSKFIESRVGWPRVVVFTPMQPSVVLPDFLLAWATFGGFREYLNSQKASATTYFLGRRVLGDVSVPLPDLELQREIVKLTTPTLLVLESIPQSVQWLGHVSNSPKTPETSSGDLTERVRELRDSVSTIVQALLGPVVVNRK